MTDQTKMIEQKFDERMQQVAEGGDFEYSLTLDTAIALSKQFETDDLLRNRFDRCLDLARIVVKNYLEEAYKNPAKALCLKTKTGLVAKHIKMTRKQVTEFLSLDPRIKQQMINGFVAAYADASMMRERQARKTREALAGISRQGLVTRDGVLADTNDNHNS